MYRECIYCNTYCNFRENCMKNLSRGVKMLHWGMTATSTKKTKTRQSREVNFRRDVTLGYDVGQDT